MPGTTFVDKSTILQASWCQSLNDFYFGLFNGAVTVPQAKAALGIATSSVRAVSSSRDLVLADAECYLVASTALSLTVPAGIFPVPTTIVINQAGAGTVTLVADDGVTINSASSLTTKSQYSTIGLLQIGTDLWTAVGDLT